MQKIKAMRKTADMTQEDLAAMLGMKQSNYSAMESGKYIPSNIEEIKKRIVDILKPIVAEKIDQLQNVLAEN